MQLIECVPNISEGRDEEILSQIIHCFDDIDGVQLLHKDVGHGVNRTVLTLAGLPGAVCEAAFRIVAKASELIDMRRHRGSHPRIGATDVCPLIPLKNISMDECISLSKQLAHRVGTELNIPVYLYGESAQLPERKSLSYIRGGEYENLFLRIDELVFKPDYGPVICNARSGAIAIGARKILIAFNISINTADLKIAKSIAQEIRKRRELQQKKIIARDSMHLIGVTNWTQLQAIGWYIKEYECCQISLNLLDYKTTSLLEVFSGVCKLASDHGVAVTGSEVIGLVPLEALLIAGKSTQMSDGYRSHSVSTEKQLIEEAVKFLKLNTIHPFDSEEKVLEYKLQQFGFDLKTID